MTLRIWWTPTLLGLTIIKSGRVGPANRVAFVERAPVGGVSLSFPASPKIEAVSVNKSNIVVYFLLNGGAEYEFHSENKDSVDKAVSELKEWASKVGLHVSPTKAVIELV
jgi:hypothetical protein